MDFSDRFFTLRDSFTSLVRWLGHQRAMPQRKALMASQQPVRTSQPRRMQSLWEHGDSMAVVSVLGHVSRLPRMVPPVSRSETSSLRSYSPPWTYSMSQAGVACQPSEVSEWLLCSSLSLALGRSLGHQGLQVECHHSLACPSLHPSSARVWRLLLTQVGGGGQLLLSMRPLIVGPF